MAEEEEAGILSPFLPRALEDTSAEVQVVSAKRKYNWWSPPPAPCTLHPSIL
jgi:hypothetical protein